MENLNTEIFDLYSPSPEDLLLHVEEEKKKPKSVTPSSKHRTMVVLWHMGYSISEIATAYKCTETAVRYVLNKTKSVEYQTLLKEEEEKVFENLFSKAAKVIKDGLDSVDPKIALAAAALWFKASGRLTMNVKVEHTAEDIVQQLMDEAERRSSLKFNNEKDEIKEIECVVH